MSQTVHASSPITGIIFDLDGTLYKMTWYLRPLLSLKLFPHLFRLTRYMKVRQALSGTDMHSGERLITALAQRLAARRDEPTIERMQSWIMHEFYDAFVGCMPYLRNSRPGLVTTLSSLKNKGYRCAVLSDFAAIKPRLEGLKIPPTLFDTIVSTESEGALKPNARPFIKIAHEWNIPCDRIAVIGDRPDTDGLGASQAGMQFVHILGGTRTAKQDYSATVRHDWASLRRVLDSLPDLHR